jgi:predicted acetyltransferase
VINLIKNNDDYLLMIPNPAHEVEYCRIMDKWEAYQEKIQPPSMRRYGEKDKFSFSKWLVDCEDDRTTGSMLTDNIPCTLYFFMNKSNEILGGIDINHANTFRGQIHIGIVPWQRGKGYGIKMFSLGLIRCKEMGIKNIQVAPRKDNHGAIQVILRNGGNLLEEFYDGDIACLRYEINLQ